MNRRVLSRGAIVCSAITLWAQPSTPASGTDSCSAPTQPDSTCAPENLSRQVDQSVHTRSAIVSNSPEATPVYVQWSDVPSSPVPEEMESLYQKLLDDAQVEAEGDRLVEAAMLIAGIPKNSRHYQTAQQFQQDWSQDIFRRVTDRYQQGDIEGAMTLLNTISPGSQLYHRAAELRQQWEQQAALFNRAIAAKNAGNWNEVVDAIESLSGTPLYRSLPIQELLLQAMTKQFTPDESLLQATTIPPQGGTNVAIPMNRLPEVSVAVADGEQLSLPPLPDTTGLEVNLDRALAWAQPAPVSTSAPASRPRFSDRFERIIRPVPSVLSQAPQPPADVTVSATPVTLPEKRAVSAPIPPISPSPAVVALTRPLKAIDLESAQSATDPFNCMEDPDLPCHPMPE